MSKRRTVVVGWTGWVLALALSGPLMAQTVSPQPATTLDRIQVFHPLPAQACFNVIADRTIVVDDFRIDIDVVVLPPPSPPICTLPPPLVLTEDLGVLAPGEYELSISGTVDGVAFGPDTTTFSVEAGPFGDLAAPIPALSFWALGVLGLMVGVVGVVAIRR